MEAAPVNPADFLFAAGWFGMYPQVPNVMGSEGVGRVLRAGSQAEQALVGQRVLILPTFTHATWADRTVVPARYAIPVTGDIDVRQLAMLALNPVTARALLNDYVSLNPGDWIGLTLANSAVGQIVIALAKWAGLNVLAVVRREEAAQRVRELGADLVIVDGDNFGGRAAQALAGARLRLLLDGTGGPQVAELVPSISDGGAVVSYTSMTGQAPTLPLADFIFRGISLASFFMPIWIRDTPRPEKERIYAELTELAEKGVISVPVEATYPLHQYREAFAHAAREGRSGKILFTFEQPAA
ncbi:zinc-dependent alcohol dehydrogenase family protein [Micromonospora sp. NPDC049559]|uniref:zinc-dependent alcohol dehydrogenase family protein n=1 Tax=Micromonospora sp. NPDC049559 TaxID=3155923 RepID=UPI00341CD911